MPAHRTIMRRIKEVLCLKWASNLTHRQVQRALGVGLETITQYLQLATEAGLDWAGAEPREQDKLERRILSPASPPAPAKRIELDCNVIHQELRRKGVTLQLLWGNTLSPIPAGARTATRSSTSATRTGRKHSSVQCVSSTAPERSCSPTSPGKPCRSSHAMAGLHSRPISLLGSGNHIAGLSFAARGAGVESGWHKPFDLMEAEMKFNGIDLHSNNGVVMVSDAEDRIVLQRRLPNELSAILAALAPHRNELAGVVVESTYNWYWRATRVAVCRT
jgi:hypothetical protein